MLIFEHRQRVGLPPSMCTPSQLTLHGLCLTREGSRAVWTQEELQAHKEGHNDASEHQLEVDFEAPITRCTRNSDATIHGIKI